MTRSLQRLEDLQAFASKQQLESIFGVWRNPRTRRYNRLGGADILIIDDIQRVLFNNRLLTETDRYERLQLWVRKLDSSDYEMTGYFKKLRKDRKTRSYST